MSAPATATAATATETSAAETSAAAVAAIDSIVVKVQKHLDAMKAKNAKLSEDNAKLRAALAEAKSSHSRIRRIPRKTGAAGAGETK